VDEEKSIDRSVERLGEEEEGKNVIVRHDIMERVDR